MVEITAEDLAGLVAAANSLVQVFENKEAGIDQKITALSQAVTSSLAGDFSVQRIYVDSISGSDTNSGASGSRLRTIDAAIKKCSPLFSINQVMLTGDLDYVISEQHSPRNGVNILIMSEFEISTTSIRAGAADTRPSIKIGLSGVVPGDGADSINNPSNRVGFFPRDGLNLTIRNCIVDLPQGFGGDTDKDGYNSGPRLVSYGSYSVGISVMFFNCRLNYGLGSFIRVDGPGLSKIGLAYCDCYLDPFAKNILSRKLVMNTYTAPISYDEISTKFYDSSSALELTTQQEAEASFYRLIYNNGLSDTRPVNLFTSKTFTREALGLV